MDKVKVIKELDTLFTQKQINHKLYENLGNTRLEVDLVLPDVLMAIKFYTLEELVYTNTSLNMKLYNNYIIAESLGYRLLQIREDIWNSKKDIIIALLLVQCGEYINYNSNKYVIKKIDAKTAYHFLEENSIHGNRKSSYKYGAFLKDTDELVLVMTFGLSFFEGKFGVWELYRVASKKYTKVKMAYSTIIEIFIKEVQDAGLTINSIINYTENSFFSGINLDKNLGFDFVAYCPPTYMILQEDNTIKNWVFSGVENRKEAKKIPNAGLKKWKLNVSQRMFE